MIAVTFLFWNVNRHAPVDQVVALALERNVDVVILAEWRSSLAPLLEGLNAVGPARYHVPFNNAEKLAFIVAAPPSAFSSVYDGSGVAIRRFSPPIGLDVTVVALHLPSKLRMSTEAQGHLAGRVCKAIESAEDAIGHRRTIVIGDFNMNPFESGLVGSEYFHAVMTRSIAARRERKVLGTKRPFFYNPMWSLLGDSSPGPPGSLYYQASSPIELFWHTVDQALLRPSLAKEFRRGDVEIVDSIGGKTLLSATGLPVKGTSDHLPLLAVVRLEEFENEREKPLGNAAIGG